MAESLESVVTGLIVLIAAIVIATSHQHRRHRRDRWLARTHGHRLWERLWHRH